MNSMDNMQKILRERAKEPEGKKCEPEFTDEEIKMYCDMVIGSARLFYGRAWRDRLSAYQVSQMTECLAVLSDNRDLPWADECCRKAVSILEGRGGFTDEELSEKKMQAVREGTLDALFRLLNQDYGFDILDQFDNEDKVPLIPALSGLDKDTCEDIKTVLTDEVFNDWDRLFFDFLCACQTQDEMNNIEVFQDEVEKLLWGVEESLMRRLGIHAYYIEELKTAFLGSCVV